MKKTITIDGNCEIAVNATGGVVIGDSGVPVYSDVAQFPTDGSVLLAFYAPPEGLTRGPLSDQKMKRVLCVFLEAEDLPNPTPVGIDVVPNNRIVHLPVGWYHVSQL